MAETATPAASVDPAPQPGDQRQRPVWSPMPGRTTASPPAGRQPLFRR
jgi:hypothetical protein